MYVRSADRMGDREYHSNINNNNNLIFHSSSLLCLSQWPTSDLIFATIYLCIYASVAIILPLLLLSIECSMFILMVECPQSVYGAAWWYDVAFIRHSILPPTIYLQAASPISSRWPLTHLLWLSRSRGLCHSLIDWVTQCPRLHSISFHVQWNISAPTGGNQSRHKGTWTQSSLLLFALLVMCANKLPLNYTLSPSKDLNPRGEQLAAAAATQKRSDAWVQVFLLHLEIQLKLRALVALHAFSRGLKSSNLTCNQQTAHVAEF